MVIFSWSSTKTICFGYICELSWFCFKKLVICLHGVQVLIIREKLAELYESEQQWSKAAQMLSGIDLDSGMRSESKIHLCFFFIIIFKNCSLNAGMFMIIFFNMNHLCNISSFLFFWCLHQSDWRCIQVDKMCPNCSPLSGGIDFFLQV